MGKKFMGKLASTIGKFDFFLVKRDNLAELNHERVNVCPASCIFRSLTKLGMMQELDFQINRGLHWKKLW